jgi:hypothetical protein
MTVGDLVLMIGAYRSSAGTLSLTEESNQNWTLFAQHNTTNCRRLIGWCIFNGTWGGTNPTINMPGTSSNGIQLLVFRPTSTSYKWKLDVTLTNSTYSAPSTPFTVTLNGITIASNSVAIAMWHSVDDNTWGSLSGSGWDKTSLANQYRISANFASTYAYYIGSGATGNVSQNQATLGGDAGATSILSFTEYIPYSPGFPTNTFRVFPRGWR